MDLLFSLLLAMVLSLAVIPVMARFGVRLGLVDHPNARKVHSSPVPRVGGIGIVLGALLPVVSLLPMDRLLSSYVGAVLVLVLFGVWDDRKEIGHLAKSIGQFIAALIVIGYGGLLVQRFPFATEANIPYWFSVSFTAFALVGAINAINHSDGLDGLAAGQSLISLLGMALVAYFSNDPFVLLVALATVGGILGFLRFNTHPALVFMGDAGSQYLGFTLAFLSVYLTHITDPELSPSVVVLLLGLPLIDILVVLYKRIKTKVNWFKATRNHLHHRLLDLGFSHQDTVVIIYSVQAFLVASGVLLRYAPDVAIFTLYGLVCISVYWPIVIAERRGWQLQMSPSDDPWVLKEYWRKQLLVIAPRKLLLYLVPTYLVIMAATITKVPRDFGVAALMALIALLADILLIRKNRSILGRALVYVISAFVVFLAVRNPPLPKEIFGILHVSFISVVAVGFLVAVKFSPGRRSVEFRVTATDFLIAIVLVAVLVAAGAKMWNSDIILFVVSMIVLFYACEFLVADRRKRVNVLVGAVAISAILVALKGFLI